MGTVDSFFRGMTIPTPEDVKSTLIPGEKVLYSVRQARIHQLTAPDEILITTERVIVRRPRWLGIKRDTRDFRYEDMGNVTVHKGVLNSTIAIKMRLLSHDLMLFAIPNDVAPKISTAIQAGIDGRYAGIGGGYREYKGTGEESRGYDGIVEEQGRHTGISEDHVRYGRDEAWDEADTIPELLTILKERYIKGEITKEQYHEMKKELLS